MYDEPFADSSQIPTFLVSELARRSVTVSLSGDGGDELFGGYNRYLLAAKVWRAFSKLPRPGKSAVNAAFRTLPGGFWEAMFSMFGWALPKSLRFGNIGDKVTRLSDALSSESPVILYQNLVSQWKNPNDLVIGGKEPASVISNAPIPRSNGEFLELMMALDLETYLQEDIMTKVDRASMAVSLESREPLLDHRLVEFAWRLPIEMRVSEGVTKRLLREALYKRVPKEMIERPKQGFAVPMGDWIRGPLRDWAEELLSEDRLKREGLLNPAPIRKVWAEHLSGKRNWHFYLWVVLMFQAWHEEWMA
jgi:asparagine synthase (glutamine-hydrolysing)